MATWYDMMRTMRGTHQIGYDAAAGGGMREVDELIGDGEKTFAEAKAPGDASPNVEMISDGFTVGEVESREAPIVAEGEAMGNTNIPMPRPEREPGVDEGEPEETKEAFENASEDRREDITIEDMHEVNPDKDASEEVGEASMGAITTAGGTDIHMGETERETPEEIRRETHTEVAPIY